MNRNTAVWSLGLTLLLLSGASAYAQPGAGGTGIYMVKEKTLRQNNSLSVEFSLDVHAAKVASADALVLVPELFTDAKSLDLPQVIINGKKRHKIFLREKSLGIKREEPAEVYRVLQSGSGDPVIRYAVTVPFEPWMDSAKLRVRENTCGCPGQEFAGGYILPTTVADNDFAPLPAAEPEEASLYLHFMEPAKETVKARSEYGEAYLNFVVNKWDILYDYKENARKLDQAVAFFKKAQEDKDIVVDGITMIGYASPEDTYQHNMDLSRNRATAFADWVMARTHFPKEIYTVAWKGEDWEKLRELVESSTMNEKYQVLNIIDTYSVFEGREAKLMNLSAGRPYKYMLENLFPQLRRVYYRIDYTVRPFTVEESRRLIQEKPARLSVFEMYEAAQSYRKGSREFNRAMDKAAELFPADAAAKNNAAAVALQEGRLQEAKALIDQTPDSPSRQNNLGVYFMLTGDYTKAGEAFNRAMQGGIPDARHNLEILGRQQAADEQKKQQQPAAPANPKAIPYTIK